MKTLRTFPTQTKGKKRQVFAVLLGISLLINSTLIYLSAIDGMILASEFNAEITDNNHNYPNGLVNVRGVKYRFGDWNIFKYEKRNGQDISSVEIVPYKGTSIVATNNNFGSLDLIYSDNGGGVHIDFYRESNGGYSLQVSAGRGPAAKKTFIFSEAGVMREE